MPTFTPDGYLAIIDALERYARARFTAEYPDLVDAERSLVQSVRDGQLSPFDVSVSDDLKEKLNAQHTLVLRAWPDLRQALYAAKIDAWLLDVTGALEKVSPQRWALNDAIKILETGQFGRHGAVSLDGHIGRVLIRTADVDTLAVSNVRLQVKSRSNAGRKTKYDWDLFWCEIARYVAENDLPERGKEPYIKADLERHMLIWAAQHFGEEPAPSGVRDRIAKLMQYVEFAENSPAR